MGYDGNDFEQNIHNVISSKKTSDDNIPQEITDAVEQINKKFVPAVESLGFKLGKPEIRKYERGGEVSIYVEFDVISMDSKFLMLTIEESRWQYGFSAEWYDNAVKKGCWVCSLGF